MFVTWYQKYGCESGMPLFKEKVIKNYALNIIFKFVLNQLHGVAVLGTIITEWDEGKQILETVD